MLVHPHFLFTLPVWGETYLTYLCKLQHLQNKPIRIITNSNFISPITPQFYKLGIFKITDLHKFEIAKVKHQHSWHVLPSALNSLFLNVSNVHHQLPQLKSQQKLYIPKFSTNRCQHQETKIWNSIPLNLRNQSFSKFKYEYKKLLLDKYK